MTSDTILLIAGAVLSLVFSYVPGLNVKFAALKPEYKRGIMAGLCLLVAAAVFGIACAGYGGNFNIEVTCDQIGLIGLIQSFIVAVIANQGAYALSPQTKAVKEAKLMAGV